MQYLIYKIYKYEKLSLYFRSFYTFDMYLNFQEWFQYFHATNKFWH